MTNGASFPMMSWPRRDRRDDELLEGPLLLLLHDGQRREDGRDDHEHEGEDAGDHEVPAGQRRIVEDADGGLDLHGAHAVRAPRREPANAGRPRLCAGRDTMSVAYVRPMAADWESEPSARSWTGDRRPAACDLPKPGRDHERKG